MPPSSDASSGERPSSRPDFWNVRYEKNEHLFGVRPNHFVAAWADHLPRDVDTVELGAGEGRNLIHLAQQKQHRVTAVDFAPAALEEADALAAAHEVSMETIEADLRAWNPSTQWDVVLVTFVQLLPHERPDFYRLIQQIIRPGGWVLGEWFRAEHLNGDYARIGPSAADRMVTADELRDHFGALSIAQCSPADVTLAEGPRLRGRAAVVRFAAQAPSSFQ